MTRVLARLGLLSVLAVAACGGSTPTPSDAASPGLRGQRTDRVVTEEGTYLIHSYCDPTAPNTRVYLTAQSGGRGLATAPDVPGCKR